MFLIWGRGDGFRAYVQNKARPATIAFVDPGADEPRFGRMGARATAAIDPRPNGRAVTFKFGPAFTLLDLLSLLEP